MLRVRFAPSLTGYLHIGSARTFILIWLYARRHGGTMILRIDDTDIERNTDASLQSIFDGLHWLELDWDEQYRQSERLDLHRRVADAIFAAGMAYRDFTPAQPDAEDKPHEGGPWLFNPGMRELSAAESDRRACAGEPFVLRFRVPRDQERYVRFRDSVYGEQSKSTADIEDFALLRSNRMPAYHMASCAEDIDLKISHIIRGQDHLSNTFKHLLIFEAAGAAPPEFSHLPLLTAPDGAKLSKRKHGPVVGRQLQRRRSNRRKGALWLNSQHLRTMPYVNFLCLLGWSPKDNREQALLRFTPSKEKASINSWRDIELVRYVKIALQQAGLCPPDDERKFQSIVDVIRSRFSTLHDFATRGRAYFADDFPIQPEAVDKLNVPGARELLRELGDRLAAAGEFTEQSIEAELGKLAAERGVKAGVIINASRAILTRQAVGRERATRRLKSA